MRRQVANVQFLDAIFTIWKPGLGAAAVAFAVNT
jgi:hypothetical protein